MGDLLSTEHLATLAVIAVAITVLVVGARTRPGPWTSLAGRGLALVLVGAEVGWWIYLVSTGARSSDLASALPLQLCDAAIFVAALALWFRWQLLVELTYFWGLAGTIQALITPDLPQHFPSFPFVQYYVAHAGVVAAALFLVVGLGLWPRRNAFVQIVALTIAYAAFVGLVDAVSGADYMYLRAKPVSATLLDALGPWPWYIAWAALIALALLFALDTPFRVLRLRRHSEKAGAEGQI